jgi:hypothetical protein
MFTKTSKALAPALVLAGASLTFLLASSPARSQSLIGDGLPASVDSNSSYYQGDAAPPHYGRPYANSRR